VRAASDAELEKLLVDARPEAPTAFVRELEASLFAAPEPERARWRAWSPVLAAGAVTLAFALVALVLSLGGLSPLQRGGDDPASAEGCITLYEPQWVMRPTLVPDKAGGFRMASRRTTIYRKVTRCP
jgi:hypothetical protein